ncbi:MAG: histidine kinase, partial [bacterium]|nr:histidine kinase [bacterium]
QFDDILSTEMTLDGDFDGVFIPPLTIQPILENCLKHGLKDNTGDGRVTVRAERRDHRVIVTVEDNGTGLEKEGEELYSRSLGNILQRLKYRNKEAAVTAENRDEGGTRVEIYFQISRK